MHLEMSGFVLGDGGLPCGGTVVSGRSDLSCLSLLAKVSKVTRVPPPLCRSLGQYPTLNRCAACS